MLFSFSRNTQTTGGTNYLVVRITPLSPNNVFVFIITSWPEDGSSTETFCRIKFFCVDYYFTMLLMNFLFSCVSITMFYQNVKRNNSVVPLFCSSTVWASHSSRSFHVNTTMYKNKSIIDKLDLNVANLVLYETHFLMTELKRFGL